MMITSPCVASDLPGVRRPGRCLPWGGDTIGDPVALAQHTEDLANKQNTAGPSALAKIYDPDRVAQDYNNYRGVDKYNWAAFFMVPIDYHERHLNFIFASCLFPCLLRAVEASYRDFDLPAPVLDVGSADGHFASLGFDQSIDVGLDACMNLSMSGRGCYSLLVEAEAASNLSGQLFFQRFQQLVPEHIPHSRTSLKTWGCT